MDKKDRNHDLVTGLIVGSAVGSVLSLLFSSKKGREASKNLSGQVLEKSKGVGRKLWDKFRKKD